MIGNKAASLALIIVCCTTASPSPSFSLRETQGIIVNGMGNRRYWCPKRFIRLGNSCYYISNEMATWQEAFFRCKEMAGGGLAILDKRWEDKYVKMTLNRNELVKLERWIGGIYDWARGVWIWGSNGRKLRYQGFSRRKPNEDNRWKCIIMDPKMLYRWGIRSCIEKKHYICETPLREISGKKVPNRRRLGKGGKEKRKYKKKLLPVETNYTT